MIQGKPEMEASTMVRLQVLELRTQQDIVLGLIGKEQPHLRPISRVLEYLTDKLQHWRDSYNKTPATVAIYVAKFQPM
jgi:hypothetical protein